ncbi:App1 family protein [Cellulomonas sp. PhB143]|uniref:App1 family protein n=1 Tax=Cellulomonas sp. PhB143 TaxID=2485186 RepID=UPI000F464DF5|nr:phosphatase domain-containing protein [Cellulomonas sp. PhB143]ROS73350.1 phosphatidate phosphatase APP1 [Cellulomonas sp. PhB143]
MPSNAPRDEPRETQRPHYAARLEDRVTGRLGRALRRRGWVPRILPYTGYGQASDGVAPGSVRVLARVLLTSPNRPARVDASFERRGYRSFLAAKAPAEPVTLEVGDAVVHVTADRGGYVDVVVPVDLAAGTHEVTFRARQGEAAVGQVVVVARGERLGVVSDIDDTVMVTAVPRLFLAAWNTFVRHPSARTPVRGMAELYRSVRATHPDAPFVYVSTGAWNTASTLTRFLETHGFPAGPLLLTDWGPTSTGWFRSGPAHKDAALDRLVRELPDVQWLLVGDDGQHDPGIYTRAAQRHRGHVAAVAIRRLTPAQQVLAHGTTTSNDPTAPGRGRADHPPHPGDTDPSAALRAPGPATVAAPDGFGLAVALRDVIEGPSTQG